jgi:hypothetical protein
MLVSRTPSAMAQATATYTATATRTPYPFPTVTPGATPTPNATANYVPTQEFMLGNMADIDPSPRLRQELQGAINAVNDVGTSIDLAEDSIDIRTNKYPLLIRGHSPIPFMRGALVLFADFEWLAILGVWFIIAFIVIAAVAAIRTIIAMWGIVERIINLIKLIPFI